MLNNDIFMMISCFVGFFGTMTQSMFSKVERRGKYNEK